jgi:hypothetical protein
MSIDLDRLLVETAQRITTTVDENGMLKYGASVSVACLFRDISSINDVQNRDELGIDGTLYFAASEVSYAVVGAVYYHPDEGYLRIKSRVRAKRLVADNTTQFIKCGVEHHRQVS